MKSFLGWWLIGFFAAGVPLESPRLGVLGGFGLWLLAVQIWPTRPCTGRCGGTGRLREPMDNTYWRNCPDCGGSARQFRWFVLPSHPARRR